MQTSSHHRLIILGSGPAGYTAALYAARANLDPILITGLQPGGQLMTTTDIGNWPGSHEQLQGPDLMRQMQAQIDALNVQCIQDCIEKVNLKNRPFTLSDSKNHRYTCDALIIATGAQAKYLGLPSEKTFQGKGVSACATCDGFFYRNQTVAVVGGGNTAVEEALYLSRIAKQTILIHRRNTFKAEKMLQQQLLERVKQGSIRLQLDCVLENIEGDERGVTGLQLKQVQTQEVIRLAINGVFIAIGHRPNTDLFQDQLALHEGYISLPYAASRNKNATTTSILGVFAAGDVADSVYRQAITSAATGCMAALDAEKYLDSLPA